MKIKNRELVYKLYKEGKTYNEISELTGCPKTSISSIVSRAGLCNRRDEKYIRTERNRKIVELYKQGLKNREIAEQVGRSYAYVSQVLKEHGISRYIDNGKSNNEEPEESNLQRAEPRKMRFEKVIYNGKQYIDVTEVFCRN